MPTESATAAATDPTDGKVRGNAGRMQSFRIREVAFRLALDCAGVTRPDFDDELRARAQAFAQCARAWSDANDQARIANGGTRSGPAKGKTTKSASRKSYGPSPSPDPLPPPDTDAK